jgi:hypothetical protein
VYSITSTDPLDIPTIRRLVPGGQVQHRTSAGGRTPGPVLLPGQAHTLRAGAGIVHDLRRGGHCLGTVQLRSPLGDLISDEAIAREMELARPVNAGMHR